MHSKPQALSAARQRLSNATTPEGDYPLKSLSLQDTVSLDLPGIAQAHPWPVATLYRQLASTLAVMADQLSASVIPKIKDPHQAVLLIEALHFARQFEACLDENKPHSCAWATITVHCWASFDAATIGAFIVRALHQNALAFSTLYTDGRDRVQDLHVTQAILIAETLASGGKSSPAVELAAGAATAAYASLLHSIAAHGGDIERFTSPRQAA